MTSQTVPDSIANRPGHGLSCTLTRKSTSKHLLFFWYFSLSQIEDLCQYLEGPNTAGMTTIGTLHSKKKVLQSTFFGFHLVTNRELVSVPGRTSTEPQCYCCGPSRYPFWSFQVLTQVPYFDKLKHQKRCSEALFIFIV